MFNIFKEFNNFLLGKMACERIEILAEQERLLVRIRDSKNPKALDCAIENIRNEVKDLVKRGHLCDILV